MSTNTFTQMIENDSVRNLKKEELGIVNTSSIVGTDNDLKSACTINTSTIAMILNNSTFDSLTPLVISIIIISPTNFTNNHE